MMPLLPSVFAACLACRFESLGSSPAVAVSGLACAVSETRVSARRREVAGEPFPREPGDLFQRAGFLEQVSRAGDNFETLDGRTEPGQRPLVEFDDRFVVAAN